MIGAPEEDFLELIEQFELHKEESRQESSTKLTCGMILASIGLIGLAVFIWFDIKDGISSLLYILLIGSLVVTVLGGFFAVSGMSDRAFTQMNIRIQRHSSLGTIAVQSILFLLVVALSAVFCIYVLMSELDGKEVSICVTIAAMLVFLTYGIYVVGSGPLSIGVQSLKSKFIARQSSVFFESLSLGCIFVAIVVVVARAGESVSSLSLALGLAVVSYFGFRVELLDRAYRETHEKMSELRWEAWRSYCQIADDERSVDSIPGIDSPPSGAHGGNCDYSFRVMTAYRKLSSLVHQAPAFSRRPVSFFGIKALCDLADARDLRLPSAEGVLVGKNRINCGNRILQMSEKEFLFATAKIFDSFVRMLDLNQNSKVADRARSDERGAKAGDVSAQSSEDFGGSELRKFTKWSKMNSVC